MTTKTHASRRNATVAIGQAAEKIYGQSGVLRTPIISGSWKMLESDAITSSYAATVFSTLPIRLCQLARETLVLGLSREWVPCSYSLCPSLRTVKAQATTGPSIEQLIHLRCRRELAQDPQTRDTWTGMLGQGQSHPPKAMRGHQFADLPTTYPWLAI